MTGISIHIRAVHHRSSNESCVFGLSTGNYLHIRRLLVSSVFYRTTHYINIVLSCVVIETASDVQFLNSILTFSALDVFTTMRYPLLLT